jgi:hypothetical protein
MIAVAYEYQKNWIIKIDLPENTPGILMWKGEKYSLKPGKNEFRL